MEAFDDYDPSSEPEVLSLIRELPDITRESLLLMLRITKIVVEKKGEDIQNVNVLIDVVEKAK
jgi:hypothetical protein